MRGLVHATFKDASGYVEDLDEAAIDEYIAEIKVADRAPALVETALLERVLSHDACEWGEAKQMAEETRQNLDKIAQICGGKAVDADHAQRWLAVCQALEQANRHLRAMIADAQPPVPSAPVASSPKTPLDARKRRKKMRKQRKSKVVMGRGMGRAPSPLLPIAQPTASPPRTPPCCKFQCSPCVWGV